MYLKSINPHDQSVVGQLTISTNQEIIQTVVRSREVFLAWGQTSLQYRLNFLQKYPSLIIKNKSKLAHLVSLEMGKPLNQALEDVDFELDYINYYLDNATKFLSPETVLQKGNSTFQITFEPYGVCVCIVPWNFPLSMVNSGVIPALIAGNTVILKPSEYTSLSQKFIFELITQTGLPPNVISLLIGRGDVGAKLLDQSIDLVWFTGSTRVGQEIYAKCGQKFIKSLCEMGGSSPAIVFADADLPNALENIFSARFSNAGQVCSAVKRLYVQKPIFNKFVKLLVDKTKTVSVGDPQTNPYLGPLVNPKQLKVLISQVDDAIQKGAKIEIGGSIPSNPKLKKGNYFLPTILTRIKPTMRVVTEEVFGPVLPVIPFTTDEEVLKFANNTPYGLSAEIYTSDLVKAKKLSSQIQAGTVAINTDSFFFPPNPFGGYKKSGIGREYGRVGLQEFAQIKLIAIK